MKLSKPLPQSRPRRFADGWLVMLGDCGHWWHADGRDEQGRAVRAELLLGAEHYMCRHKGRSIAVFGPFANETWWHVATEG